MDLIKIGKYIAGKRKSLGMTQKLPQAPDAINTDLMTTAEIHSKLQEGFEDIEAGRVQDAKAAFAAFRENHR